MEREKDLNNFIPALWADEISSKLVSQVSLSPFLTLQVSHLSVDA